MLAANATADARSLQCLAQSACLSWSRRAPVAFPVGKTRTAHMAMSEKCFRLMRQTLCAPLCAPTGTTTGEVSVAGEADDSPPCVAACVEANCVVRAAVKPDAGYANVAY